jgi:hypothetical protein
MAEVTEGAVGPKRSKTDIDELESWLETNCKEKMPVKEIIERWQYLTGHAERTTRAYLKAIARFDKIKIFRYDGVQYCLWIEGRTEGQPAVRLEKRFNVETMRTEMMEEEEPPESPTEYMQRKKREEINNVRRAMGYGDI